MSLRGRPVERSASLPDGRTALIWVGVPDDPYIAKSEMDTVALEVRIDDEVVAAVNTVLDADQESEALELAREIGAGLESGTVEPSAGALEPLAEKLR